jgi:hypothetical protein
LQDQPDMLIEKIVETFLLVLLTLIHKKRLLNPNYKFTFLYDVQLPEISKVIFIEILLYVRYIYIYIYIIVRTLHIYIYITYIYTHARFDKKRK